MSQRNTPRSGPIDEVQHPEMLEAHVVTPGAAPRVHGYDVESDLARHYSSAELTYLTLASELPNPDQLAAFEVAFQFLAPLSVAEAPTHAAVLSKICGSGSSPTASVSAIALAEQAQDFTERHRDLMGWLASREGPLPQSFTTTRKEAQRSKKRLIRALADRGVTIPDLDLDLEREAALVCVLCFAGLVEPWQIVTLLVMARLPAVMAEAASWRPRAFAEYPADLPRYEYREER